MNLLDNMAELLKFVLTRNFENFVLFQGEVIRADFMVSHRQTVLELDIDTHPTRFQIHVNYPAEKIESEDVMKVLTAWNASEAVVDVKSTGWSAETIEDFLLDLAIQNPKRSRT